MQYVNMYCKFAIEEWVCVLQSLPTESICVFVVLVVIVSHGLCRHQGCMCAILSPTPWHKGGQVRRDQQSMAVEFPKRLPGGSKPFSSSSKVFQFILSKAKRKQSVSSFIIFVCLKKHILTYLVTMASKRNSTAHHHQFKSFGVVLHVHTVHTSDQ